MSAHFAILGCYFQSILEQLPVVFLWPTPSSLIKLAVVTRHVHAVTAKVSLCSDQTEKKLTLEIFRHIVF